MMAASLVDTHAMLYWLLKPGKLSRAASRHLSDPSHQFRVSVASLLEATYLIEIGRIEARMADILEWIRKQDAWEIVPFDTLALAKTPDVNTRDPFDRILVATALAHDWRLVTKDRWSHSSFPKLALW
jgi:PIN domain nuclease of toxin-antitoxin system